MTKPFRELVSENIRLAQSQKALLPSGYQRVGHIAILNLRPEVSDLAKEMAALLLEKYPYIRTVCLKEDSVSGELREPSVRWIAGEKDTTTVQKEYGCLYRLDVTKVMFSKGNLSERARVPCLVRPGETIVDMFAGIGYFTIPIAVHSKPSRIFSIELNPNAFRFLQENIKLNKVSGKVEPILGDCRKSGLGKVADRILMGYMPKTYEYLPTAFSLLKKGGGVIHYHDTYRKDELWDKPLERLEEAAEEAGYNLKVKRKRIVKTFAPNVLHIVADAACTA